MNKKIVIVSAFDTFHNYKINFSEKLLESLPNDHDHFILKKIILPTVYDESYTILRGKIKQIKPNFVLMLGQAISREMISLEQRAVNLNDSEVIDNSGLSLKNKKIIHEDFTHITNPINLDNIIQNLPSKTLKYIRKSLDAGTFVCNNIYFKMLFENSLKCLFIHIPPFEKINKKTQREIILQVIESIIDIEEI